MSRNMSSGPGMVAWQEGRGETLHSTPGPGHHRPHLPATQYRQPSRGSHYLTAVGPGCPKPSPLSSPPLLPFFLLSTLLVHFLIFWILLFYACQCGYVLYSEHCTGTVWTVWTLGPGRRQQCGGGMLWPGQPRWEGVRWRTLRSPCCIDTPTPYIRNILPPVSLVLYQSDELWILAVSGRLLLLH